MADHDPAVQAVHDHIIAARWHVSHLGGQTLTLTDDEVWECAEEFVAAARRHIEAEAREGWVPEERVAVWADADERLRPSTLIRERNEAEQLALHAAKGVKRLREQLDEAHAEVARLRAALAPFAVLLDALDAHGGYDPPGGWLFRLDTDPPVTLTYQMLVNARAALAPTGDGPPPCTRYQGSAHPACSLPAGHDGPCTPDGLPAVLSQRPCTGCRTGAHDRCSGVAQEWSDGPCRRLVDRRCRCLADGHREGSDSLLGPHDAGGVCPTCGGPCRLWQGASDDQ